MFLNRTEWNRIKCKLEGAVVVVAFRNRLYPTDIMGRHFLRSLMKN